MIDEREGEGLDGDISEHRREESKRHTPANAWSHESQSPVAPKFCASRGKKEIELKR